MRGSQLFLIERLHASNSWTRKKRIEFTFLPSAARRLLSTSYFVYTPLKYRVNGIYTVKNCSDRMLSMSKYSVPIMASSLKYSTSQYTTDVPEEILQPLPAAMEENCLYINGMPCRPHSDETVGVYNPSTGRKIFCLPDADEVDVDRAVQAAHSAFPHWSALPSVQRGAFLVRIADLIEQGIRRFATLESFDTGKPLRESEVDISDVVTCLRLSASYADEFDEKRESSIDFENHEYRCKTRYEPYGVVGLITPWNYPLLMAIQKVAPAIAAGCTCVLKPSEYASMTCIEFSRICTLANLPNGVFNVITGLGRTAGEQLVKHPLIKKVSFTGSIPTGRAIMKNAADMIKPVHLELGGKSPMIIFYDVDLNATIDWIMMGIFWCAGQVCSATSRILIEASIYEKVCEQLKIAVEKLSIGPFDTKRTYDVGPVISKQQYDKIQKYMELAEEEGLSLLTGADKVFTDENYEGGYFIRPTIYKDVPITSKLWVEEIFGPVLCLRSFSTESEAIAEANNSPYGLAAAVMTSDDNRRKRILNSFEAGFVWGNCSQPVGQQLPFGGYKMSGFGRECGYDGFKEFLQLKTIVECNSTYSEKCFTK
ncbi:putative Betaine aldehyde dehydrogenase 1, chloroplastic [Cardiosporidium cionae]|uniref:Betaine aldehyde dehydrogenase 1, chloroplastic n=1 Tax=Cardiosporidium cionae TaxID=476202 RepID=A0ABQ7JAA0_9APIC|nr:putative Betaine aldehyde dehydrogenase 1, chloroplastic [Cardiosporidium cionae]|eukprot:KAF8820917.1 putative Betaine aldehyde dehydrogenase 1, chloroplastic [Cardiosporidium cionae]